jgi:1-deoxyxylulose-5-phosphate synthase
LRTYRRIGATLPGRARISAIQNKYDILNGESQKQPGVLAYAAREAIDFVAFSPLALGLLTGRYLDLGKVGKGDRLFDEGALQAASSKEVMALLHRLATVARDAGLELSQLALAYMLEQPGMGPAIPTSSSVAQLEANAAAGKIILSPKMKREVKAILARGRAN